MPLRFEDTGDAKGDGARLLGDRDDGAAAGDDDGSPAPPPPSGCCTEPVTPVSRNTLRLRWHMLWLACVALLGSYYCYDIPAATYTQMENQFSGNSTGSSNDDGDGSGCGGSGSSFPTNFNLLYSVYSWPNVVLPFFGGYLADVLGVRIMMVAFLALLVLGQVIFAVGGSMTVAGGAWYVMWLGRVVFGFGGESLSVAQSALVADWFAGRELAFALALNLALARLGSVVNDVASNAVATAYGFPWALWLGAIVCGVSLAAGVWMYYLDVSTEDRLARNRGFRPKAHASLLSLVVCAPLWARACRARGARVGDGGASGDDAFDSLVAGRSDGGVAAAAEEEEGAKEVIDLSAVLQFPVTFWLLCISCVCTYACVLSFNNFAGSFFLQKWLVLPNKVPVWKLSLEERNNLSTEATNILLITYLTAGFFAPVMGAIIDRVGFRALLNCISSALIVGVHVLLAYTELDPRGPLVLLGLCYSVYASALWPSVALVTEPAYHATAYGIVTAVQNLGLAVVPLGVAKLMPTCDCATYDECVAAYTQVETLLIVIGGVGFLASLALNIADSRSRTKVLNRTSGQVAAFLEEEKGTGAAAW